LRVPRGVEEIVMPAVVAAVAETKRGMGGGDSRDGESVVELGEIGGGEGDSSGKLPVVESESSSGEEAIAAMVEQGRRGLWVV
jgi:hypothetical protein